MSERVSRIELFHISVPLPETFYPSWIPFLPQTQNNHTLLRIETESGLVGVSTGTAMEDERAGLGKLLGPYLMDADALDIDAVAQRLREASYLGWRNAWIEGAFWDIKAQAAGRPLYQLLAAELGRPAAEAQARVEEVPIYFSMGELKRGERLRRYIEEAKQRGVRGVKIRVHSMDEAQDIAAVEEARRFAGDDLELMVDANQGWRVALLGEAPLWDLERAVRFGKVCDAQGYRWIEEPLDMYDYDGQAALRQRVDTAIAGAELNAGWPEFKIMLEKGCYDIYQPDATFAGGVSHVLKLIGACLADERLSFSPHTWSNGVGFLLNLHLFAAMPAARWLMLEYPYQPPGWLPEYRDAPLADPIEVTPRGTVAVPQQPGLGATISRRKLRRYGHRFYHLTKPRLIAHTIRSKGLKTALELARVKKAQAQKAAPD